MHLTIIIMKVATYTVDVNLVIIMYILLHQFISNPEVLFHYKFLSQIILVRGKERVDVIEAIFSTTGLKKGTFVVV